ncbi:MAG: hypothetical protein JW709_03980 [Sedimentisphaerales bacterium]|nr:hypothetical protein [Sedimentisphaerales bacterium]
MPEVDDLLVFPRKFNNAGVEYMVTGGFAGIIYGEPRTTHDIDMVINLRRQDISKLLASFPEEEFYIPPQEVLRLEIDREAHGHFNLIHHATGVKADCYPLGHDALHAWAFPLRRRMEFQNESLWIAPPEYVIVRKLQWLAESGGERHIRDIRSMLTLSAETIDNEALIKKIAHLGLEKLWREIEKDSY